MSSDIRIKSDYKMERSAEQTQGCNQGVRRVRLVRVLSLTHKVAIGDQGGGNYGRRLPAVNVHQDYAMIFSSESQLKVVCKV
jgi:hypothetical protein